MGKDEEAKQVLAKIASVNGTELPTELGLEDNRDTVSYWIVRFDRETTPGGNYTWDNYPGENYSLGNLSLCQLLFMTTTL